MEDRTFDKQSLENKKPLTAAQRKAKQRQKQKEIKNGTYQTPLIEQAKVDILNIKDFSLDELFKDDKYNGKLDNEKIKQLKNFIYNHKQKLKKEQENQYTKEQQVINIKEKAKRLGNQQIPQLHQSLLTPQTYQERIDLIKQKIQENLYLFLEYMENYQYPSQDFMKIIIDLYNDFDDDTSTKLFARVCSRHRGEILQINSLMVQKVMSFLLEKKIDNIAAFGLLRLVYQNNISFYDFPIQLLIDFQTQYEQTILNFLQSISPLKFQVIESLPPTCFTFTDPILKALKDGGDILHTQIPYHFLPYVIEIICFSFNNEEDKFQYFLQIFKEGCKKLYEILLISDFCNLLQAISDKTKSMNGQFFRKIDHSSHILEKAFFLLQEKKIEQFNHETVSLLIDSNQEKIQMLTQKPKIIKQGSKSVIQQMFIQCQQKNSQNCFKYVFLDEVIRDDYLDIFYSMGISNLLPVQEICFRYCSSLKQEGRYFIQYDIGQGKTSLCLAVAAINVKNGFIVYIVNNSNDLAFRDFKKAYKIKDTLKIDIFWYNDNDFNVDTKNCIIFCTFNHYIKAYQQLMTQQKQNHLCIFDEFDSSIFEPNPLQQRASKYFKIIHIYQVLQISFIQQKLKSNFVNFSQNHSEKMKIYCDFIKVFSNKKYFTGTIVKTCIQQVQKSPVILILKDGFTQIRSSLVNKGLVVENLAFASIDIIEGAMNVFTEKQNGAFQVFIINDTQGRGLDFFSNTEIEKNGGICVIIACLPTCYLQFNQFIGRTARIGNNGKYSVILYDKNAQNCDGNTYLNKNLSQLQIKIYYLFRILKTTISNNIMKKILLIIILMKSKMTKNYGMRCKMENNQRMMKILIIK